MKSNNKKIVITALMAGLSFVLNTMIHFPSMAPFQHFMNVITTSIVGPWYGCMAAFICGSLRMMSGRPIGAIVGAVFGPIIGGLIYKKTKNVYGLAAGEIIGTGIVGALAVYPIMCTFYNLEGVSWYYYVPFYTPSAVVGACMGVAVILILKKSKVFDRIKKNIE